MALSDIPFVVSVTNEVYSQEGNGGVSAVTAWKTIHTAPDTLDTAAAGANLVDPAGIDVEAGVVSAIQVAGHGSGVRIRLNYKSGAYTTNVQLQAFGLNRSTGKVERLRGLAIDRSAAGPTFTLTKSATDLDDGTDSYTECIEVDAVGNEFVFVLILVAGVALGAGSYIEARII